METPQATLELNAVLLESTQPEALADFYRAAFDLPAPKAYGPDHLGLRLANVYLGFDRVKERQAGRGATQLWFRVDPVEGKYADLLRLGATSVLPPNREKAPGEVIAMVLDPEGNLLGLITDAK